MQLLREVRNMSMVYDGGDGDDQHSAMLSFFINDKFAMSTLIQTNFTKPFIALNFHLDNAVSTVNVSSVNVYTDA